MRILVVNAGSSSLKLRLLGDHDEALGSEDLAPVDRLRDDDLGRAVERLGSFDAVGHRIVHGGERYREPVVVDGDVRAELGALTDLAPVHQPKSLAALDAVTGLAPDVPAVACFDTAFHATLSPAAATYAVPAKWRDRLHLRRYGFHGLSHAYAARRATAGIGDAGRLVTCHLGAGASLAAVRGHRCVDTTMGFTPLEGLVMATRSGTVDPGAVLWLITHQGLDPGAVAHSLEHESGLLAMAGTSDMAAVVEACRRGEPTATLALDVYVHRLRAAIAAMVASLGGLDALVFTGGVGENAPTVRAAAVAGLGFLGAALDAQRNDEAVGGAADPEADITAAGSSVRTLVVAAREDLEIARGVRARLR
ncbi:MAG TPA: acetate/propionate family kinase [Acidimicrobiales bacterium]|nr:acetate/propionate family kinase [Acidimicrobiales bacterium]